MSTSAQPVIDIPSEWPRAVRVFRNLEESEGITAAQWDAIVNWLVSTEFDDRSYVAGEAAALLIRDRAPAHVRVQLRGHCETAEDWLLHLLTIALERDQDEQYVDLLKRAAQSKLPGVRISARSRLSQ